MFLKNIQLYRSQIIRKIKTKFINNLTLFVMRWMSNRWKGNEAAIAQIFNVIVLIQD